MEDKKFDMEKMGIKGKIRQYCCSFFVNITTAAARMSSGSSRALLKSSNISMPEPPEIAFSNLIHYT